jgi:hypothetical protein
MKSIKKWLMVMELNREQACDVNVQDTISHSQTNYGSSISTKQILLTGGIPCIIGRSITVGIECQK